MHTGTFGFERNSGMDKPIDFLTARQTSCALGRPYIVPTTSMSIAVPHVGLARGMNDWSVWPLTTCAVGWRYWLGAHDWLERNFAALTFATDLYCNTYWMRWWRWTVTAAPNSAGQWGSRPRRSHPHCLSGIV